MPKEDAEWKARAKDFKQRLAATGLTMSVFQLESGISRNVLYNLSIGQRPSSDAIAAQLDDAFTRLRK